MPTLGFLKKKRTREDKGDQHNSATKTTSHNSTKSTSSVMSKQTSNNQQQQQLSSAGNPFQQSEAAQQPQSSSPPNPSNTSQPQNPATNINNLANTQQPNGGGGPSSSSSPPAADGNNNNNHNNLAALDRPSLAPTGVPLPSASPGTDPQQLLQQQQQALPKPEMQVDQGAAQQQQQQQQMPSAAPPMYQQYQHPLQQQQQEQGQQQQQQHQSTPLQHNAQQQYQQPNQYSHHSTPSQSQPRVTKGKYSLVDFEIQRTLGTGSFGRVHLVQSKHNSRFYAIKVLKKAQVVKMKQVEHTNDERRMLSEVKHPFLITLWGTFQDTKNLYMVMDFVEGGELFSLLRKSGRFPNPVAKFYAAEVTLALEYMHSKNIVYRDLKPENLLLDRHGHLKITDFGFAKRVADKTWTLCGTPDYLAPEVVSNKGYNKSVDWWSLGILVYEMLCGYTPFWDSGSPMRIYENILKGKVKYPAYINVDAQDLLQKLITADLTKRLGNLYGGSQDVRNHPWFAEVTWDRLARKDIDAPYTPPVKAGAGDASQFDKYPEDPDIYGSDVGKDEYGHLFTEF